MTNDAQHPASQDGDLRFIDEDAQTRSARNPWKVLIADDDEEVHLATKLVLKDFEFKNRGIEFLDAYDGKDACDLISTNPDIAVVLLDVVMESTDAGLRAVQCIRDEIGNHRVRIILRTGQPGHAPEKDVVLKYHIPISGRIVAVANSYMALTSQWPWREAFTHEQALEMIQQDSETLFDPKVVDSFVAVVDGFRQRMTSGVVGP